MLDAFNLHQLLLPLRVKSVPILTIYMDITIFAFNGFYDLWNVGTKK